MLCLPAFTPVANDAHAVGDSGECVVPSGCTPLPCLASFAMFGSRPSSMYLRTRRGSMPSKPSTTSFCWNCSGERPGPQASAPTQTTVSDVRRRFTRLCWSRNYNIWGMRILGVDVGARRVGLAISDATRTLARPLTTLTVDGARDAVDRVAAAAARLSAEDDGLDAIVVGLPAHLDG